jgi:hypothetical protein
VQWYNRVRETVLEVEFPLIEGQLEEIDQQLKRAEKDLSWNSDGMLMVPKYKSRYQYIESIAIGNSFPR